MISIRTSLSLIFLLAVTNSRAETISDITQAVTINSYSNFHTGLFVADGNSRGFTDGASPRVPAYQHDPARDFIRDTFLALGYDTWLDPFSFNSYLEDGQFYDYQGCNNVIGVKWGSGGTNIYIVGAHYDSVDSGQSGINFLCPGADDNASGVAGMLESARAIQNYTFRDTIIFIAFDAEEKDYRGSKHFVDTHLTDTPGATNSMLFYKPLIKSMVNLDMIAYNDPANGDQIVLGSRKKNLTDSPLSLALEAAVLSYTTLVPFRDGGYNASDHLAFYDAGIAAIHVIEHDLEDYWNSSPPFIENPHYHKATDSIDQAGYISYPYATEVTKSITGYLCEQAGVILPATLIPTVTTNTFEICWSNTPGVAYSLYGTEGLSPSNLWTFLQHMPATNVQTELAVQIDLNTSTQHIFKVISE
ncbi:M20/M25/M40 family metallo-hydrolase [Pontiellaceae bacterium B12227]|nr:M20/M25/M40 family metallo-hydrolase [Pontiellaceae bacterium B12227]